MAYKYKYGKDGYFGLVAGEGSERKPAARNRKATKRVGTGDVVSCAPSIAALEANERFAFVMWLNADPRNAQANRFWREQLSVAMAELREAKRTANVRNQPRHEPSHE